MRRWLQSLARQFSRPTPIAGPKQTAAAANSLLTTSIQPQTVQQREASLSTSDKPAETDQIQKDGEPKAEVFKSSFDQLFRTLARSAYKPNNKVTVVGAGDVGVATVFSLIAKGITNDVSIIDFNDEKLQGELMDLQSGSKFLPNVRVRASKDYAISSESRICILAPCADSPSAIGDDVDQINVNAEVLKAVIPQLLKYSPDTILLVAIDPVDVFSYLVWRLSELPKSRVLGTGTNLYTATFQHLLAKRVGLAACACQGYIIGETGYSSVPVWSGSGVTVGGVQLQRLNPHIGTEKDPENWAELHRQVLLNEQQLRENKGGTSWASALSIADICAAILYDSNCTRPLSTYVKGEYNINDELFLSIPCILGAAGITDVVRLPLSPAELTKLQRSADIIKIDQNRMRIVQ